MKRILLLTALIPIVAQAQPYARVIEGDLVWGPSDTIPASVSWSMDRPYHAATYRHESDGVREWVADTVPEGHYVVSRTITLEDGKWVESITTEPWPAPPLYDSEAWDYTFPILADHPYPADVPIGGMAYRLAGDPITWWVVRRGDLESTQVSAHDDAGEPIYRSRNLSTGVERTIRVGALERAANVALSPLLSDLPAEAVLDRSDLFPDWRPNYGRVEVGEHFRHNGNVYRVLQSHVTQADWTPPTVPALFVLIAPPGHVEWMAGVAYTIGDRVFYNDTEYQCLQSHTSQVGWEPPNVPALWAVAL